MNSCVMGPGDGWHTGASIHGWSALWDVRDRQHWGGYGDGPPRLPMRAITAVVNGLWLLQQDARLFGEEGLSSGILCRAPLCKACSLSTSHIFRIASYPIEECWNGIIPCANNCCLNLTFFFFFARGAGWAWMSLLPAREGRLTGKMNLKNS